MDFQEIMSTVRDLGNLRSETQLGTQLLKRYTNMGQDKLSQLLMTLFKEWLVKTIASTGTGAVVLPGDVLQIMDCTRASIPCEKIPVEDKTSIGRSLNHPGTAEFPGYVHEGSKVIFYPALATTAYEIRHRKRLVPMIEGSMISVSATTITLSGDALAIDDIYNDYQLTLYTLTAGIKSAPNTFRITDYTGATKVATLSGTIAHPITYYGALWSLIPAEYHGLIVDAALWYLSRSGLYKGQTPEQIMKGINESVRAELGITVPVRKEMAQE